METTNLTRREPQVVEKRSQRRRPVFTPRTDIYETNEAIVLVADLPGVDESSLEVTVEKRLLSIAGTIAPAVPEGYRLSYREYRSGDFRASFRLSDGVDANGISATVKDGVLRLELRKVAAARSRKIEIKTQ